MHISSTMNLDHLRERMGGPATTREAVHLRASLAGLGAWDRTEDVPEDEWTRLVDAAATQAKHDDGTASNDEIEVRANWADAAGLIQWRAIGAEEWAATGHQVADAQHDPDEALALVSEWLDAQS